MEKQQKSNELLFVLMDWIKKDLTIIVVCIIALGACAYTIWTVGSYQDAINEHWLDQWNSSCPCMSNYHPDPVIANISFNLGGNYNGNIYKD